MKCEECRALLEEHFDRALSERQTALVGTHLQSCGLCAEEYEQIVREQQVYQRYERDVEVTSALWLAIERRIESEVSRPEVRQGGSSNLVRRWLEILGTLRLSPAMVAAMLALAIGATLLVAKYASKQPTSEKSLVQLAGNGGDKPEQPREATPNNPETPGPDASDGGSKSVVKNRQPVAHKPTAAELIREAEGKYISAIAILSRDANRRKATLDPQAQVRFETALALIDNTIDETRRAARKNPGDPIALQYLLSSYARKVDVLREMARE